MIRGQIIKETNDAEVRYTTYKQLLEAFSIFAQVKDIRMIKDKISGEVKDFAFVEYFTLDESQYAMAQIKQNPVKIRDNPIYVTYSKIRRSEEMRVKLIFILGFTRPF